MNYSKKNIKRSVRLFFVAILAGALFYPFLTSPAASQEFSDSEVDRMIEEQQTFFSQVLQSTDARARQDLGLDSEESRSSYTPSSSSSSVSFPGMFSGGNKRTGAPPSSFDTGADQSESQIPENAIVRYKNKHKDNPLAGVEMPKRVFRNIKRYR